MSSNTIVRQTSCTGKLSFYTAHLHLAFAEDACSAAPPCQGSLKVKERCKETMPPPPRKVTVLQRYLQRSDRQPGACLADIHGYHHLLASGDCICCREGKQRDVGLDPCFAKQAAFTPSLPFSRLQLKGRLLVISDACYSSFLLPPRSAVDPLPDTLLSTAQAS